MNTITSNEPIVKVRPNLWQAADGAVIGFGAILAPGGLYFCFTCNTAECGHAASVDEAWISGDDSAEDELIFASSADLWPDDLGLAEPTL